MDNTENSKSWQDSSDGWVKTMTESKEKKEKYQQYLETVENPVSYRCWLRAEARYARYFENIKYENNTGKVCFKFGVTHHGGEDE